MKAVCVLENYGYIIFMTENKQVRVIVRLKNLSPGKHGFHIHTYGDLRQGCKSTCGHFNPDNTNHGDRKNPKTKRHTGDLGNITVNSKGVCSTDFLDNCIKLKGKYSIIGRSVVIHEGEDDLGLGGLNEKGEIIDKKVHLESIKTGNSGKRITCGVIGYASS